MAKQMCFEAMLGTLLGISVSGKCYDVSKCYYKSTIYLWDSFSSFNFINDFSLTIKIKQVHHRESLEKIERYKESANHPPFQHPEIAGERCPHLAGSLHTLSAVWTITTRTRSQYKTGLHSERSVGKRELTARSRGQIHGGKWLRAISSQGHLVKRPNRIVCWRQARTIHPPPRYGEDEEPHQVVRLIRYWRWGLLIKFT